MNKTLVCVAILVHLFSFFLLLSTFLANPFEPVTSGNPAVTDLFVFNQ